MSVLTMPSAVTSALDALSAALDDVAALDPDRVTWVEQEALVRGLSAAARRLEASRLQALDAFARGGSWEDGQHLSPATWVRDELVTARGDAGRDLALGRALRDWPVVAAALADGEISARAAGVVCSALSRLPDVDAETVELVLAAARVCDPLTLARELAARVAAADPEQAQQDADTVHDRRTLQHSISHDDMGRLDGWLDPELAELFNDALRTEMLRDRVAGDERTVGQRRHDAFGRLVRRAVTAPDAPRRHGQPVQLLVLTSPEAVADAAAATPEATPSRTWAPPAGNGAPPARTAGGHVLTRGALSRLSCSSPLARCLLEGPVPLDLGRTVRIATEAQYRALVARDRGCAVRGCDQPASWCTPHHVIPWQHGGPTDLSNLLLLCEGHHHALHDRERHLPLKDGRTLTPTGALAGPDPPGG